MPPTSKTEIIEVLEDIAILLELKGENPFKVRAYQSGARTLEQLEDDMGELIEENRLSSIKGIGDALSQKIEELYTTGKLEYYDKLKASVPPGLVEMLSIPGLGGKKIKVLHKELGVETIADLQKACEEGLVAGLKGFGQKTQDNIQAGIKNREAYSKRHYWWKANETAQPILARLLELEGVENAECAGSLRRGMETCGDLDFIVASDRPEPVMEWFTTMPHVIEVTAKGDTKSSVRLEGGMQADLRVVPPKTFYFTLHHFTGSKDHNVKMRQRALQRGYSLSEWGLKAEKEGKQSIETVGSEAELFQLLDLAYIEPELREGMGEIEAAEEGKLPDLVNESELKGVFHNHTLASDGRDSLEEMVQAAQDMGWEYIGIADHSKASFQANGLSEERLLKQVEQIKALNESGKFKTHVFTGIECDILTDGSLDFEDDILKRLDYVVVSPHVSLQQSEDEMTKRLIKAIENPYADMLGHVTGRLLLRREGSKANVKKVIDAAIANGKVIELNADPHRLDMDWRYWRQAAERGLKTSINPDAHRTEGLQFVKNGVKIARKGWLRKEDVINTLSLQEVKAALKKIRDGAAK